MFYQLFARYYSSGKEKAALAAFFDNSMLNRK